VAISAGAGFFGALTYIAWLVLLLGSLAALNT
jgi:hypothetical protein